MSVKVITDSTSDMPPEIAARLGISVIPQKVIFGTEELRDGVDITGDEFYRRLVSSAALPTTSQASVGEFVELYESVAPGADGIVSVHVSSGVSGTVNSAQQAAQQANIGCEVRVIDSLQASMATGLIAIEAAICANDGGDLAQVAECAQNAAARAELFVLMDTLEYLQKGGRIGKARATIGSLLKIKPMIILREGVVHELGKERTHRRGMQKLQSVAEDFAPLDDVCVLYSTTPDEARDLAAQLGALLPSDKEPIIAQIGPSVGVYAGPSTIGVAALRSGGA